MRLFLFSAQIDPIQNVEDICESMQLFPKEDFLTGDQLMFEFSPEVSLKTAFPLLDINEKGHLKAEMGAFLMYANAFANVSQICFLELLKKLPSNYGFEYFLWRPLIVTDS